jgi:putative hydrolase of the HAD superfamily
MARGSQPPSPVRFVLFDLYDTLVGFHRPSLRAARQELADWTGLSADMLDEIDRRTWPERMDGSHVRLEDELVAMLRAVGAPPAPDRVAALRSAELHAWRKAARLYADVHPSLAALRQERTRLGLVSNCCHLTRPLLRDWGLLKCFDVVVLSCEVQCIKPHDEILERALEEIGGRPEDGALVDDREPNVAAARSFGLPAYRIARTPAIIPDGSHVIRDLRDLPLLRRSSN